VDELTRGTRCAKDLVGRDNSGFTVKGLRQGNITGMKEPA